MNVKHSIKILMTSCFRCLKRLKYKELPKEPQGLRNYCTYYPPITQEENDSIPNKNRITINAHLLDDGQISISLPMKGVYEGIKKYVRTAENQVFDSSLFKIGYRPVGTTYYALFYVPHTMTIRQMLIESGLFNPDIYYYIDDYLLTPSTLEKTFEKLHKEDHLPERAVISTRQTKWIFTQSKILRLGPSYMVSRRYT